MNMNVKNTASWFISKTGLEYRYCSFMMNGKAPTLVMRRVPGRKSMFQLHYSRSRRIGRKAA